MPEWSYVELDVNGEQHELRCSPQATLLDVLRRDLSLTGSKRGCNQGVCGACSVLLDGKVVRSCLTLAANVGDRKVTTIEGLAGDGRIKAIERAFLESGAVQCGFCTPGMVIALQALRESTNTPTEAELTEAMSGNLCRCSGYVKIMEAAARVTGLRS
jgi:carbon-monoxide dehydrogenase small subunit